METFLFSMESPIPEDLYDCLEYNDEEPLNYDYVASKIPGLDHFFSDTYIEQGLVSDTGKRTREGSDNIPEARRQKLYRHQASVTHEMMTI